MRNEIDPENVEDIDGIRTYTVSHIAELKARAFINRSRARDTYDIAFLMEHYPHEILFSTFEKVQQHLQERGLDDLCDSFEREKQEDLLLSHFDGADIVLRLQESIQSYQISEADEVSSSENDILVGYTEIGF